MTAAASGMISLLLDAVPVLAIVLLGISFLRRRSEYRREEEQLREEIRLFREGKGREETNHE